MARTETKFEDDNALELSEELLRTTKARSARLVRRGTVPPEFDMGDYTSFSTLGDVPRTNALTLNFPDQEIE